MRWPDRTDRERFFEKVEQPANGSSCWVWRASRCSAGYGNFFFGGRVIGAHRASWALFRSDPLPADQLVLHACDNPACVNPSHLFLGTHQDNADDKMRKGRHTWANKTHCERGHALSGGNLYVNPKGLRVCRACRRIHDRARLLRENPNARKRATRSDFTGEREVAA